MPHEGLVELRLRIAELESLRLYSEPISADPTPESLEWCERTRSVLYHMEKSGPLLSEGFEREILGLRIGDMAVSDDRPVRLEADRRKARAYLLAVVEDPAAVATRVYRSKNDPVLLTERDESLVTPAVAFVKQYFPQLAGRIPPEAKPLSLGYGVFYGLSTHMHQTKKEWFRKQAARPFNEDPDVPDGFFIAGIQSRGGSEALVAMWKSKGRCFFFLETYIYFYTDAGDLATQVNTELCRAIAAWEENASES
ncbi:MAG: hypothetical protein NTW19_01365 [Planctomycetota bacterium]|nr:hypothetical protein [Planctomycetota bacterium]